MFKHRGQEEERCLKIYGKANFKNFTFHAAYKKQYVFKCNLRIKHNGDESP